MLVELPLKYTPPPPAPVVVLAPDVVRAAVLLDIAPVPEYVLVEPEVFFSPIYTLALAAVVLSAKTPPPEVLAMLFSMLPPLR